MFMRKDQVLSTFFSWHAFCFIYYNEEIKKERVEVANIDSQVSAYTFELARFTAGFGQVPLEDEHIQQVKKVLLDYYCAAITGTKTDVSRQVYGYLLKSSGPGNVCVVGRETGLSKENAAFANGTSAHCLDFDDGHSIGSIHSGVVVIPAVLSVAEEIEASPEDIMRAIIVGYEICLRISSTVHPASRKRGFHNTPTSGIFGAVAGAAYLYKFDAEQVAQAFGNAASFSSGLFAFLGSGSEIKRIHPGKAARDAITAVELVRFGVGGPTRVLEDPNGFFHAFAGDEVQADRIYRDLGSAFEIMNVYFKPYPCCRHLHSSIDAVYQIKKKTAIDPGQVQKVRIGVNRIAAAHDHCKFGSLLDAQMSIPYSIAGAILHDHLSLDIFLTKTEELVRLSELVDVYVDEEAEESYPEKRMARVYIDLKDGSTLSAVVDHPLGEPNNPISDEDLEGKFISNCSSVIGQEKAQQWIEHLRRWPEEENDFLFSV